MAAGPGPGRGEPVQPVPVDRLQRPPQRRVRRHRTEHLALVTQHGQVRQHPTPISDHHGGIDEDPAPVVHRGEPPSRQRPRAALGQTGPVRDHPQRHRTRMVDHAVAVDFGDHTGRPVGKLIHLGSAPLIRGIVGLDNPILAAQRALPLF